MDHRVNMFDEFEMTQDEKDFVSNVHHSGGTSMSSAEIHLILAQFYHAKQLERSSKSNDRSTKVMTWLTIVIALFTAVQGVSAVLTYIK